jgi:1-acylglycerone phosphate reductase
MAGQSVLITGASEGGIGDALAQEFHRQGLRVFATARDLSKVQHLLQKGLDVIKLDVTSATSISEAVATVEKETGGKLDYLVNNAGAGKCSTCFDCG